MRLIDAEPLEQKLFPLADKALAKNPYERASICAFRRAFEMVLNAPTIDLRPQQTPLDRSRWEGCDTCNNTPGLMFGVITLAIGKRYLSTNDHQLKFCPECGRPLTEEAWAEQERRINDEKID